MDWESTIKTSHLKGHQVLHQNQSPIPQADYASKGYALLLIDPRWAPKTKIKSRVLKI